MLLQNGIVVALGDGVATSAPLGTSGNPLYLTGVTVSGGFKPAQLARTAKSLNLAANVGTIVVPAGGGRIEVINPDPATILYASWDGSPTTGAAATGAIPIASGGGSYIADGVIGTLFLWSSNATLNVTANLWS